MTFREDGEGLNDRAERLDHDVQTAQKTLHQARERRMNLLEQELADTRERLDQMQASFDALRDRPPSEPPNIKPPSPLTNLARALPVLLPVGMIAMLGFAIGQGSARRSPLRRLPSPPTTMSQARMTGSASTRGATYDSIISTSSRIRWNSKVRSATGINIPAGSECRIEGSFTSNGTLLIRSDIEVWCGDKLVYEKGAYTGPEAVVSVDEYASAGSSFVYNLDVEDLHRPAFDKRSMASIDTEAHLAIISRDVSDPFQLELEVNPVSVPTASSGPLFNLLRPSNTVPSARLARSAHVVNATGSAPVASGEKCSVKVIPATPRSGWSCRTFIRCGDKAIYGEQRTGYAECSGNDDSLQIRDLGNTLEDGDAKLEADFSKGKILLSDNDTTVWSVTLQLD